MRVVLDTNVLVSGLLSPFGTPAQVVRLAASGVVRLCYDTRLVSEYRQVLARPAFAFAAAPVEALLTHLVAQGEPADARPLLTRLPDPDDEPFLEVALAAAADCLVTGNLRHYPAAACAGMPVLSPSGFLDLHRERWSSGPEQP